MFNIIKLIKRFKFEKPVKCEKINTHWKTPHKNINIRIFAQNNAQKTKKF